MAQLAEKVILITGSSRCTGATIARNAAQAGARVVINYAGTQADADAVAMAITEAGGQVLAVQADVSQPDDVRRLFAEAITRFGRVDVLVNTVGVMVLTSLQDATDDVFKRTLSLSVKGILNTLCEAVTQLADGGIVINVCSATTRLTMPTYAACYASRGTVEQLTRVFAQEMGARNIAVNTISPGPVNPELLPKGKLPEGSSISGTDAFSCTHEPQDIADLVLRLASGQGRHALV